MMEMRFEIVYSKNYSRRKGFWRIFTIFDLFFGKFKIWKIDGNKFWNYLRAIL